MLLPFIWMLITSLKEDQQVFSWPPSWIPDPVVPRNYVDAWQVASFSRYFINSGFVAVTITVVSLYLNSLAGYAFAKFRFPGRDALFLYLLATMMIPIYATMVPIFLLLKNIGWLDSYKGLIVPFLATGFGVFLMRQFFYTLPTDLIEAARIDGCGELRIFMQIVIPMSKPPFATLGIFTFMQSWNNFIWPLIVVKSDEMRTIPLAIASLSQGLYVMSWPILMAGASFAITPVLIVFLFFQKLFVRGIALTGLKG
jgi:multiple sugar transport system permease protein